MTLEEEIQLLERKLELLKEIQSLEAYKITTIKPYFPTYPIFPPPVTYPPFWYTTTDGTEVKIPDSVTTCDMPSRLEGVDPFVREGMCQPCTFS
jgi:hypothetical protein